MNIGERIKLFRKRAELGEKINVTGTTITRYEKNSRTPDINTLKKIAEVLNISLNELLLSNSTAINELYYDLIEWFDDYIGFEMWCNNDYASNQYFEKFKVTFDIDFPETIEITEKLLTKMLIALVRHHLNKFINIFDIHQEIIMSFSNSNLELINNELKFFNLSLQQLKNDLSTDEIELTKITNNSYKNQHTTTYLNALESLQKILDYVKDTSNQKILKLIDYDLNFQKKILDELFYNLEDKLLIEAINKGKITLHINSTEENNKEEK